MNNESCAVKYSNYTFDNPPTEYCKPHYDGLLCWGYTKASTNTSQLCPRIKGFDSSVSVWRSCNENGTWFDISSSKNSTGEHNVYENCMNRETRNLVHMCKLVDCMKVVGITRKIEMIGLCLSLISLVISLIIFYKYRVLRNNRTTIHKNLFLAMLLQVIVRLITYLDQEYKQIEKVVTHGEGAPHYLCEICLILLEFSKIASIMWMFVEGLYLHNAITFTVFQEHSYIKLYCLLGWSVPALLTIIWTLTMVFQDNDECWFLYNFLRNYWILEGPCSALIVINILFLLNIIRILVSKLRQSRISEIQQVRKAVRAAIFLVPLMGTTNVLFIVDYRHFNVSWKFALWTYVSYFFFSFQGFFLSTLYCFLNDEVRHTVRSSVSLYMSLRHDNTQRRNSMDNTAKITAPACSNCAVQNTKQYLSNASYQKQECDIQHGWR